MNIINKLFSSYRLINGFLLFMAVTAMAFALLFLQKYLGLSACPLCVFQRVGMIGIGIFALLAVMINPAKMWQRLILWLGAFASSVWGLAVAGRHVWLQHLPADEVPACGPGLNYWLDVLPIMQVFEEVFKGSGECAEVVWTFLGLTIPEQTLLVFAFLTLVLLVLLVKIVKKRV